MPSAFPYILSFWMYAPLILRAVAGVYFFYFGYSALNKGWNERIHLFHRINLRPAKLFAYSFSILELIAGMLLLMGLFVQITAIVLAVISITAISIKIYDPSLVRNNVHNYILLLTILITLFILGPGYHAMDLPL